MDLGTSIGAGSRNEFLGRYVAEVSGNPIGTWTPLSGNGLTHPVPVRNGRVRSSRRCVRSPLRPAEGAKALVERLAEAAVKYRITEHQDPLCV